MKYYVHAPHRAGCVHGREYFSSLFALSSVNSDVMQASCVCCSTATSSAVCQRWSRRNKVVPAGYRSGKYCGTMTSVSRARRQHTDVRAPHPLATDRWVLRYYDVSVTCPLATDLASIAALWRQCHVPAGCRSGEYCGTPLSARQSHPVGTDRANVQCTFNHVLM